MNQKSIKRNYIYNVIYQILNLLIPVITTPYLSRVLDADGIGTISYTESVVSYFVLFATMGITTHGQREISYVQDSVEKRSKIFWETKLIQFATAFIAFFCYAVFVMLQKENVFIYWMFSLNILAVFVDVTWFFQGMEEFKKIVIRNILLKLINIVYIFMLVRTKNDLVIYALGLALFTFLGNLSLWGYLPIYIKKVSISSLEPLKSIKTIISLFIPTIAIQIYTVLDKTMIGLITKNSFENGYYEQAIRMSRMVLMLVTALGTVMIPRIGYHYEKKEYDTVKTLMYRGYRFVWFLGIPLCIGLILVSKNFVPWFLGEGYEKVIPLLGVLAFLILAIGINNVTGMQYMIPTKRQNLFTLSVLIGAGVNFIMNIFLITMFQSVGAALASVFAETVIALVQLYMVREELSVKRVFKESGHYVIAGGIMAVALSIENIYLFPSIRNTIIMVVSGSLVYFSTLLILKDEFFCSNIKRIIKK